MSIQLLRIFLIVFVICEHIYPLFGTESSYLLANGSFAVSMFFIISGYFSFPLMNKYDGNYVTYFRYLINKKSGMIVQYFIFILLSICYVLIIKRIPNNFLASILASIIGVNVFFEELTMNGFIGPGWFFQALMICYISLPLVTTINRKNNPRLKLYSIIFLHLITNSLLLFIDNGQWYSYYFPLLRVLDFSLGLSLRTNSYKLVDFNYKITIAISLIGLYFLHILDINNNISILKESYYLILNSILFSSLLKYEADKKLKTSRPHFNIDIINKIINVICQNMFTIYLFHFLLLKFTTLLGNRIHYPTHLLLMSIGLIIICIIFNKIKLTK